MKHYVVTVRIHQPATFDMQRRKGLLKLSMSRHKRSHAKKD